MTVVSSREFATNHNLYQNLALDEQVFIKNDIYIYHIKSLNNNYLRKKLLLEKVLQKESKAVHTSSMKVL